ncbi:hypothetical protein NitYY0826_C0402 [Nitratiruptor sp. YY08-26]|uniref:hypothetical protein n=1 Tax=unclassified Nitratiruptor TaxID=2624044 RepID=UPI001915A746|nr:MULTISPECIES: hypothetical protein [unclassified Nitratiruptor]BCD61547.1 hypothetical protein NitYY0813_C0401 [Nitratiruptor sp. YY08-13]BCD65481.1 hypothetical protein NitYY0826_C0402 [Nitratiruptor sp. YY08-26]
MSRWLIVGLLFVAQIVMAGSWANFYGKKGVSEYAAFIYPRNNGEILIGHENVILNVDAHGQILLQKRLRVENHDLDVRSIVEDSDGNFVLGGKRGGYLVLVKYDSNGNEIWKTGYQSGDTYPNKIIQDSDGNYVVVGGTQDGATELLVLKVDKDGNKLWSKREQYQRYVTVGTDIVESDNGEYVVCGYYEDNQGKYKGMIVRFTKDGNIDKKFFIDFGNDCDVFCRAITKLHDGSLAIVGSVSVNCIDDIFFLKLQGDSLQIANAKIYGKDNSDSGLAIFAADDYILIGGTTNEYCNGCDDDQIWLAKLSSDGSILSQKYVFIEKGSHLTGIGQGSNGEIIVGGGGYNETDNDILLMKLTSDLEIDDPNCDIIRDIDLTERIENPTLNNVDFNEYTTLPQITIGKIELFNSDDEVFHICKETIAPRVTVPLSPFSKLILIVGILFFVMKFFKEEQKV